MGESGQVKVFEWDEPALNFTQLGQRFYGEAPHDFLGSSVALSSEGNTLVIGTDQYGTGKPGYVEVYELVAATSKYKQLGQRLSGEGFGDAFGYALALAANSR